MRCAIGASLLCTLTACCATPKPCSPWCADAYVRPSPKKLDETTTPGRVLRSEFGAAWGEAKSACRSSATCDPARLKSIGHTAGAFRLYPKKVSDSGPTAHGWRGLKACAKDVTKLMDRAFSDEVGLDAIEIDAHSHPATGIAYVVHDEPDWKKMDSIPVAAGAPNMGRLFLQNNTLSKTLEHFAQRYAPASHSVVIELKQPGGCNNRDLLPDGMCAWRIQQIVKQASSAAPWRELPKGALQFASFSRQALTTAAKTIEAEKLGALVDFHWIAGLGKGSSPECILAAFSKAVDRKTENDRKWLEGDSKWLDSVWLTPRCFSKAHQVIEEINQRRGEASSPPLAMGVSTYQQKHRKVLNWVEALTQHEKVPKIASFIYDIEEDETRSTKLYEAPSAQSGAIAEVDTSKLRIDAHAHIFNGEDIPPFGFIQDIVVKDEIVWFSKLLAPLTFPLAKLVRFLADGYEQELGQLQAKLQTKLTPDGLAHLEACCTPEPSSQRRKKEEPASDKRAKLDRAVRRIPLLRGLTSPRFQNAFALIERYPNIDLFVVAMVDLDLWVQSTYSDVTNEGSKTTIPQQVALTTRISVMNDGKLLPFVAYDPYRDVITEGKALEWAQKAVMEQGFVGIKMYPPLGFRPLNNASSPLPYPKAFTGRLRKHRKVLLGNTPPLSKPLTPDQRRKLHQAFAKALDAKLQELYKWAELEQVPIMVHGNLSNEVNPKAAKDIVHPKHWAAVLEKFPGLRINIGHFGGYSALIGAKSPNIAAGVSKLMSPKNKMYADLSHIPAGKLRSGSRGWRRKGRVYWNRLKSLHDAPESVLNERLMYGSDWFMPNATVKSSDQLPAEFEAWLEPLWKDPAKGSAAFMGLNAAKFLGLCEGEKTRDRLNDFYKKVGIKPQWRDKLREEDCR